MRDAPPLQLPPQYCASSIEYVVNCHEKVPSPSPSFFHTKVCLQEGGDRGPKLHRKRPALQDPFSGAILIGDTFIWGLGCRAGLAWYWPPTQALIY